jgi:glycosyltransferase involved in cell wall biosynthesis
MRKNTVVGICTDTVMKDGKPILKNGERQHGAIGWYRIVNPIKKLGGEILIGLTLSNKPENALWLKEKGQIWFSKLSDNEGIDNIYSAHKEFTACKLVLDVDDEPGEINEGHPDYKALEEKRDMRMRMLKIADHIVVATEPIKESIKGINPYITVIPNAIDPKIWYKQNKKRTDGKIRIGWMSSGSHFADLPVIRPVMDEILKKYPNVEFHFAGMTWDEHQEGRFFHHVGRFGYRHLHRPPEGHEVQPVQEQYQMDGGGDARNTDRCLGCCPVSRHPTRKNRIPGLQQ